MIDIKILKTLQKEDRVMLLNTKKENQQPKNCRVMGTTEYALHVMNPSREFLVYRWTEYGTSWKVTDYTKNSNAETTDKPTSPIGKNSVVKPVKAEKTPENSIPTSITELKPKKEESCAPLNVSVNTEEPTPTKDGNLSILDNQPVDDTKTVGEDNTIIKDTTSENEQPAAVVKEAKKSKTSMAQKKAIEKYTSKFERINCRLESGTLDKISALGYKSNNQFIVEAVKEKLAGTKSPAPDLKKSDEIISLDKVRDRKTKISKEIFESIKDTIVSEELFMDKELSSKEVLAIIEKKFMEG